VVCQLLLGAGRLDISCDRCCSTVLGSTIFIVEGEADPAQVEEDDEDLKAAVPQGAAEVHMPGETTSPRLLLAPCSDCSATWAPVTT
jgi:hypothetical protein